MGVSTPKKFLYKAAFTNHPTVLNLHINMYCIYPLTKKKQNLLSYLREDHLPLPYLKRERTVSLNLYLLNPLDVLTIGSPGHILKSKPRSESDHDLTSHTPLIPQLCPLIWLLARMKINVFSPCHDEAYFLIRERK